MTEDIRFALSAVTVHFPRCWKPAGTADRLHPVCMHRLALGSGVLSAGSAAFPGSKDHDKKKQALLSQWLQGKGTVNALMQDLLNNKAVLQIYQRESEAEKKQASMHAYQ